MTENIKKIIIVVIVIVVAFFGSKMIFSGDQTGSATLVADKASTQQFVDGQVILGLLNKLSLVTLDESIFSNRTFVSLVSFERPLADQVAGRQNPFLPIGVDNASTLTPNNVSTATSSRIR